jgi:hypothetical protein
LEKAGGGMKRDQQRALSDRQRGRTADFSPKTACQIAAQPCFT